MLGRLFHHFHIAQISGDGDRLDYKSKVGLLGISAVGTLPPPKGGGPQG
jgi:hypothetical protein